MNVFEKFCCAAVRSGESGALTAKLYFVGINDFQPLLSTFTFPIWVKFHIRYLYEILFGIGEFC
jgi:hypothetical protein